MAYTYSKLATVTVGSSGSSSINFIAIPQNYTDLVIKFSIRNTRATFGPGYLQLVLNSVTSNFTRRTLERDWDNLSSASSRNGADNYISYSIGIDYDTANTFGNGEIYIPNYTSSNYKSISSDAVNENNANENTLGMFASLWSNTQPINSIGLESTGTTFKQYSTATLYGIKAEV